MEIEKILNNFIFNYKYFYVHISLCIIITIIKIFQDKNLIKKLKNLFTRIGFIISTTLICILYFYINNNQKKFNKNILLSTEKAIIAFIIALLAYFEQILTPFWIILIVSYNIQDI